MSPAPDDRQSALHASLLEALPGDLWIRFDVDPGSLEDAATDPGRAVAFVSHHSWRDVRWVTAFAADPLDPAHAGSAVRLLVALVDQAQARDQPVRGVTVPRGGAEHLPAGLVLADVDEWDAWCTQVAPPMQSTPYGDAAVVTTLEGDDERIGALLAVSSPTASIRPGDPRVVRWAAIEDPEHGLPDTGGLAALVAVTRQRSGSHHLNSVATHPDRRGRRLARLLCAEVTAEALAAGVPAVSLGMYAENDAARSLYASLGFTWLRGSTSGALVAPGP